MAVKLSSNPADKSRAVVRETSGKDPMFYETLMVCLEAHGHGLTIWKKGKRTKYTISYADIYRFAYQRAAHAARDGGKA